MVNYSFFALAASALLASSNALELTTADFDEKTKGKTVFLKCYAPWCGHCQAMADDWAKLEKDFEGHKVALVASVDCTADESDELCERINVEVCFFVDDGLGIMNLPIYTTTNMETI